MIETDPIHEIERLLAAEIEATARRVMDWEPDDVEVHFRDDTIVYLLEGDGLPGADPDLIAGMERGISEAVWTTVGREVIPPINRSRVSERSLLVMLRLR